MLKKKQDEATVAKLQQQLRQVASLFQTRSGPGSRKRALSCASTMAKTAAKQTFKLNDSELRGLPSNKCGRSIKFSLGVLVRESRRKHMHLFDTKVQNSD